MLDKIGTLLGMLIGASLVIFGIIWPDHLSNYYMYQFREFELGLEALKVSQAPIEDIRAFKESFKISDNEKIVGWYSQSDKIIVNTEPLTEFDKITDFRGIFPGNSDK